ncbi:MAG: NAD(P)H-dependent glycerol-3-phosphate dehydrogenase [Candidatus Marinimicrobia bacterium]|jgi:glycerol-3-phosphate dehydrogenase (NAD(P)+)|nr:NAD(P)H-dependent glycerol-3-phosphate dehydrogenase [Candidatus Neomarinimicrobiota bacterium]MDP6837169.1 NAD(P)H-dependent glycerol-3-phosphate dehydrogenase [Candidatus Neomarinimicrobiota bacterium]|tara:strand:- start:1303 stop:2301 length:999 start_codon:yes stop_codon:yes gene_type:complete
MENKTIAVLGGGSWGATIAQHLSNLGHDVTVWHRNRHELDVMQNERTHPFLPQLVFDGRIRFIDDFTLFEASDIVVFGVPSHGVRDVAAKMADRIGDAVVVNLAKGIENDTLLRMSEVIGEVGRVSDKRIVTLTGPSHAEEVAQGVPTTIVAAGVDGSSTEAVQKSFSSETLRVYANADIAGAELGGSVKNVIAVAAGTCDGIGFGDNAKAALITRGIVEITRLGVVMGARAQTFAGLSGIGDLIATCLSRHSRNRAVGEQIGRGRKLKEILSEMKMVAEGVRTAKSVHALRERHGIEMPICEATYAVLFEDVDPKEAVRNLMTRDLIYEHD